MRLGQIRSAELGIKRPGIAACLAACLALAGCILLPGKFDSALDLRDNGTFSFRYDGQMIFLPLSDEFGDENNGQGEDVALEAMAEEYCYDEDTLEERECTEEELANFARENEEARERAAQRERERKEEVAKLLGGIDPQDPEAGKKLAEKLERQIGWESVTYLGNGVFDVRYKLAGRLDHDFIFPSIEGMNFVPPFVQVHRRDGGMIRVNAPGYSAGDAGNGLSPALFVLGRAMGGSSANDDKPEGLGSELINGRFTITTDGDILANNTDEGPAQTANGRQLVWDIDAASKQPPTALVRIR